MSSKTKTTNVKEEARQALVPKLRFPEFRGADGWKTTPLGELGAIVTGKTPSTKEDNLWGGKILFITPTDITEGEKYQHSTQRTVVETRGTKVLPPGSVVYTCIASIGKMALTVVPSVTNQQINAVEPNGKTAQEFIYYSLANLTPWIKSIPATSTLPIINKTQFSKFIISHPNDKQEQRQIAECLSSVDEVIAAQARKLDALKTHKKGLMQQLFPREGETKPRLRFPEFQDNGEWLEGTLANACQMQAGKFVSASDIHEQREDGMFPCYGGNGLRGYTRSFTHTGKYPLIGRQGALCGNVKFATGQFHGTEHALVANHAGVYYNAYSEDLFVWDNDPENGETNVQLDIRKSSLNRFHSLLSEDDIRAKLNRYRPNYRFDFIPHDNPEDGIKSVMFFHEVADPEDPNKVSKVPRKISRGEERIFVWCFFLALFEVEWWADKQSSHFFIDDPVSSLDDHNIFITASTIYDLIEQHHETRKFVITTHHIGLFSILSDMLTKGEKASKFKKQTRVCTLSRKDDEVSLESCRNDARRLRSPALRAKVCSAV